MHKERGREAENRAVVAVVCFWCLLVPAVGQATESCAYSSRKVGNCQNTELNWLTWPRVRSTTSSSTRGQCLIAVLCCSL